MPNVPNPPSPNRCSRSRARFPIKVMGRTQDGFAQAIVDRRRAPRAGLRSGDARDALVERRQLPVGHGDDQCDLARAARRPLSRSHVASDGDDGAVMAQSRAARSVRALGRTDYETTWRAMQAFTAARTARRRDEIWLTEHRADLHAGTGRAARASAARQRHPGAQGRPRRADHVPRAGTARRLSAVRPQARAAPAFARWCGRIEASVVEWLDSMGISAYGKPAAPGVYVMVAGTEAKIAALGLKVRNGCTYHGLALNVAMDLAPFADIDPCGYKGLAVTQLADLGVARTVDEAGAELAPILARTLCGHSHERASPPADQRRRRQAQGRGEDRAHPHQGRRRRAAEEARLDPRARAVVAALLRDQEDPARAQPAHGVRGSVVPEHRRVLRQGHRDVHDHGRHLHAALPVLRRRPRPPAAARRGGARAISRRRSPRSSLRYVVITSVDRDDLRDGGAQHFVDCIRAVREHSPQTQIEVLVPDFRGRLDRALDILARGAARRDEPQPRDRAAPVQAGAARLRLRAFARAAAEFKARFPDMPTKSGLMVGLGETDDEILAVMRDMRAHGIDMLTIGQYLQPTAGHLPVLRYVHPDTFAMFEREA